MCGLFGFAGNSDPDIGAITETALWLEHLRGGDAFGFAWVNAAGRLRSIKRPGPLADVSWMLKEAGDARLLIGHVRYTTNGAPEYNINNHPHPCDGGWLVHNGTVPLHYTLAADHRLITHSHCDSEVIAKLVEIAEPRRRAEQLAWALGVAARGQPQAAMALWSRPRRLVAGVFGKPLAYCRMDGDTYLSTLTECLPVKGHYLRPGHVYAVGPGSKPAPRCNIVSPKKIITLF